jgi:endoglucanase
MTRLLVAGVTGLALAFAAPGVALAGQGGRPSAGNPLAGARFFVDSQSDAAAQERRWAAEGRTEDAQLMRAISTRPGATWFGEPDRGREGVATRVGRVVGRAAAARQTPVIVVYSIPFRDCGSFSSGGSASAAAYRRYVRGIARGIGGRRAVVILEPDAAAHVADRCVSGARGDERERLLRWAVAVLAAGRRTHVYLDAGNASWIPPAQLAPILRRAGIARADGFALNVANFQRTDRTLVHGRAISRRLGGRHFVIDTSRNGNGPWESADPQPWCNPPGRALGTPPTTRTGDPAVDAFLWIKDPGDSDGPCRSGPPAGEWWPEYALELARGRHARSAGRRRSATMASTAAGAQGASSARARSA